MHRLTYGFVPALALSLVACGPEGFEDATTQASLIDGTPEAVGVLRFLNSEETTFELLDDEVALDRRAARNLIDERPFDSIVEVDDVAYVGPSALGKLTAFAEQNDFVPGGSGLLGTYDGVEFTVDEASAVLDFTNNASLSELDDDASLDRRAANGIVAARPIPSILQLAKVPYVGPSALQRLKDYAVVVPEYPICESNADCTAPARCNGIPRNGRFGRCISTMQVPGEWDQCASDAECQGQLECIGLTLGPNSGYCAPAWMSATFESGGVSSIPDGVAGGTGSSVLAFGLASVPMDIVVYLDLEHDRPEDLVIELFDPNGTRSLLADHDASLDGNGTNELLALNGISRDDEVNGRWRLVVTDTVAGVAGRFVGWRVFISSRWD